MLIYVCIDTNTVICLVLICFFREEVAQEGRSTSGSQHEAGSSLGGRVPEQDSLSTLASGPQKGPSQQEPLLCPEGRASAPTTPGHGFCVAHGLPCCRETLQNLGPLCQRPHPILGPELLPTEHKGLDAGRKPSR